MTPVASAPPPSPPALVAPPTPAPAAPPTAAAPVAAPAPPTEHAASEALQLIHFAFDKAVIQPAAAKTLDASAAWLKANPRQLLLIEGYTDERGMISYGKERPVCTAHNEACWAKNRRDVFLTEEC